MTVVFAHFTCCVTVVTRDPNRSYFTSLKRIKHERLDFFPIAERGFSKMRADIIVLRRREGVPLGEMGLFVCRVQRVRKMALR